MELSNNSVIVDYERNEENGNISFKRESHSTLYPCGPWILEERTLNDVLVRVRLINIESGNVDYVIFPEVYVNCVKLYQNNGIYYLDIGDDDGYFYDSKVYQLYENGKFIEITGEEIEDYEDVTSGYDEEFDGNSINTFFQINGKLYTDSIIGSIIDNTEKWLITEVPQG
jgi:hypothetical protein